MITLIKPILFAFFKSDAVKKLLVDLLDKLAKETDNDLDDTAVAALKVALKVWQQCRVQFPAFVFGIGLLRKTPFAEPVW